MRAARRTLLNPGHGARDMRRAGVFASLGKALLPRVISRVFALGAPQVSRVSILVLVLVSLFGALEKRCRSNGKQGDN